MIRPVLKAIGNLSLDIAPLFTGLLVATAQTPPVDVIGFLTQYLLTIFIFLFWSSACLLVPHLLPKGLEVTYKAFFNVVALFLVVIVFGILLVILSRHSTGIVYQLILVLLLLLSLSYRFATLKEKGKYITTQSFYLFGTGVLSFMFTESFTWQAIVFSASVALGLLVLKALIFGIKINENLWNASAVCGIFLLIFSHDLPNYYASCLISPFIGAFVQKRYPLTGLKCLAPSVFLAILVALSFV